MRTNWHDIIAGYREHAAWRHLRNAIAVLAAGNWVGCGHTQSAPSSAPPRDSVTFVVEVVDANGAPLADVDVEGLVDVNPGPAESTCCMTERFAAGTTGERGVVILEGAPYTFRPFHFRASHLDWPTRTVGTGMLLGLRRVVRISLGPARDVRGQVEWGPDCVPAPGLEVFASEPRVRSKIAADGSFVVEGVAPWASIWVDVCERRASVALTVGDGRPVVLRLPGTEPQ